MRVLIAGAGQAGVSVARHMSQLSHSVTILDRDAQVARRVFEQFGIVALAGDATDAQLLRQAEVDRADVAVAMLHRDADNLAVALLARELGARRVMVRMRDIDYRGAYARAGVHRILSETEILVGALAMSIEFEPVRHAMLLGGGESVAFELEIPADAAVCGHTVSAIAMSPDFPSSCVFAGIFGPDGMQSPRGGTVVPGGQQILLVSRREEMSRVVEFFMRRGNGSFGPGNPSLNPRGGASLPPR
jgi:trk system potassium uptake protein TrkA